MSVRGGPAGTAFGPEVGQDHDAPLAGAAGVPEELLAHPMPHASSVRAVGFAGTEGSSPAPTRMSPRYEFHRRRIPRGDPKGVGIREDPSRRAWVDQAGTDRHRWIDGGTQPTTPQREHDWGSSEGT